MTESRCYKQGPGAEVEAGVVARGREMKPGAKARASCQGQKLNTEAGAGTGGIRQKPGVADECRGLEIWPAANAVARG